MTPPTPDSIARRLVTRWRSLTGGSRVRDPDRPTLVALSGGPDSSALLIALSTVEKAPIIAAHVMHDLRPMDEVERDAETAQELAQRLGVRYLEGAVRIPKGDNQESLARARRYEMLTQIAHQTGCDYVATAHHAEDQLETMLMAMTRGTGLGGLAGIAPKRELSGEVCLIRPALGATRDELRMICEAEEWEPAFDATNEDISRTRARIRKHVVPHLIEHAGHSLPERLASLSDHLREANELVESAAQSITSRASQSTSSITLDVDLLRDQPRIVIGAVLRQLAHALMGPLGADKRGSKHLDPIIDALIEQGEHAKSFDLAHIRVEVTSRALTLQDIHSAR